MKTLIQGLKEGRLIGVDVEKILGLGEEDLNNMTFKQLIEVLDAVKTYFISQELDIEQQIELYSKAVLVLMKAREKLAAVKKLKEEIDKKYEEFMKNFG